MVHSDFNVTPVDTDMNERMMGMSEENERLRAALEKFVDNARERDVICDDIVLTTYEVLEEAQQALKGE